MGIRKAQVAKLLAAKKAADAGGPPEDLTKVVRESTGYEINEAMDRSGQGTESWAAVGRPSRGR